MPLSVGRMVYRDKKCRRRRATASATLEQILAGRRRNKSWAGFTFRHFEGVVNRKACRLGSHLFHTRDHVWMGAVPNRLRTVAALVRAELYALAQRSFL